MTMDPGATWTLGDLAALFALEIGCPLEPWQVGFLAANLPESAPRPADGVSD